MTENDLDRIVEIPPFELMGPAMRNLNERQRRFVCALAATGGDQHEAYVWAGYTAANNNVARANGSRLAASEDVKDAR
jgi:phage terminase small subunit